MPDLADLADRIRVALPVKPFRVRFRGADLDLDPARVLSPLALGTLRAHGLAAWLALALGDLDLTLDEDETQAIASSLVTQIAATDPPLVLNLDGAAVRVNVAALRSDRLLALLAAGDVVAWARAVADPLPRRFTRATARALAARIVAGAESCA